MFNIMIRCAYDCTKLESSLENGIITSGLMRIVILLASGRAARTLKVYI